MVLYDFPKIDKYHIFFFFFFNKALTIGIFYWSCNCLSLQRMESDKNPFSYAQTISAIYWTCFSLLSCIMILEGKKVAKNVQSKYMCMHITSQVNHTKNKRSDGNRESQFSALQMRKWKHSSKYNFVPASFHVAVAHK